MSSQSPPMDPNQATFPTRADAERLSKTHRPNAPKGAVWVWGEDDQLGRLNLLTPERVSEAAKEIQEGRIIPLNLPLDEPKPPSFNRPAFKHEIITLAPGIAYDDAYSLNTQSSTQWDGFRHVANWPDGVFYNGVTKLDILGPSSNTKCGIGAWAQHGIAGRGVLLDYWGYAESRDIHYDPFDYHEISYADLFRCGAAQGLDIRPASRGGDIKPGDILLVRSGWCAVFKEGPEQYMKAAVRPHKLGKDDPHRWAGLKQEDEINDWLHDCWFSAVAGDAPSFEAWPSKEEYFLHCHLLALWGVPIGELWDLERLAQSCKELNRYTFFLTSSPANVPKGIGSHANAMAII